MSKETLRCCLPCIVYRLKIVWENREGESVPEQRWFLLENGGQSKEGGKKPTHVICLYSIEQSKKVKSKIIVWGDEVSNNKEEKKPQEPLLALEGSSITNHKPQRANFLVIQTHAKNAGGQATSGAEISNNSQANYILDDAEKSVYYGIQFRRDEDLQTFSSTLSDCIKQYTKASFSQVMGELQFISGARSATLNTTQRPKSTRMPRIPATESPTVELAISEHPLATPKSKPTPPKQPEQPPVPAPTTVVSAPVPQKLPEAAPKKEVRIQPPVPQYYPAAIIPGALNLEQFKAHAKHMIEMHDKQAQFHQQERDYWAKMLNQM